MLPEEGQASFLAELMPPTVDGEEDGCVASAFHKAVFCGGVGSNQHSGSTEKTNMLKEMSDTTGCVSVMIAE